MELLPLDQGDWLDDLPPTHPSRLPRLARQYGPGLPLGVAERLLINIEERIDRVVGRTTKTPDPLSLASSRKSDAIAWRRAFGGVRVVRGVYRFRTHEEADAWLWRTIARPAPTT